MKQALYSRPCQRNYWCWRWVIVCIIYGLFSVVSFSDIAFANSNNYNKDNHKGLGTGSSQYPPPPAVSSSSEVPFPSREATPDASTVATTGSGATPSSGIVQVVETEVWDAVSNEWVGGGKEGSRWTDENGNSSSSPLECEPPEGFDFVGDWKIVVQTGRDAMGWEYEFRYLQSPSRRRIWLRSLERKRKEEDKDALRMRQKREMIGKRDLLRPQSFLALLLQQLKDDFNFKGYGLSIYKSCLFRNSFGIGFRLPLSTNFDWWDRHPALPSFSTSLCFYHPWCVGIWCSASINLALIKWVIGTCAMMIYIAASWILYSIVLRGLVIASSIVLYPLLGTLYTLPDQKAPYISQLFSARPNFRSDVSERIGMSVSYRWSASRGYEWRLSKWYGYMPTLLTHRRTIHSIAEPLISKARTTIDNYRTFSALKGTSPSTKVNKPAVSKLKKDPKDDPPATATGESTSKSGSTRSSTASLGWWHKHFAALGLSSAFPMPSPPGFSVSTVLSLSGLYLKEQSKLSTTTSTDEPSSVSRNDRLEASDEMLSTLLDKQQEEKESEKQGARLQRQTGVDPRIATKTKSSL